MTILNGHLAWRLLAFLQSVFYKHQPIFFFFLKKSFWRRFCQAEECDKFFDELQMRSNRFKLTFINTVQESCELYRMILNNCRYENPMNLVNFSLVQKNDEIICTVLLIFRAFRGPKCFDVLLGYKTSWKNWYC